MPELAISLQLDEYWSPVSHLNHVADNAELRKAYDKAREKITAFFASEGKIINFTSAGNSLEIICHFSNWTLCSSELLSMNCVINLTLLITSASSQ